jgi:molybdopterin-guanine dinucleotide biosynthesis protein A
LGGQVLGAILAGGRSSRFGSDKALAEFRGKPLLAHVLDAMAPQVDACVVVGRDWPDLLRIDDRPGPGFGPLGGVCAALHHAARTGHARVLVSPCDILFLPDDAVHKLAPPPSVVRGQRLIGLWPADLADQLQGFLLSNKGFAVRDFLGLAGFRECELPAPVNVNTREALRELSSE